MTDLAHGVFPRSRISPPSRQEVFFNLLARGPFFSFDFRGAFPLRTSPRRPPLTRNSDSHLQARERFFTFTTSTLCDRTWIPFFLPHFLSNPGRDFFFPLRSVNSFPPPQLRTHILTVIKFFWETLLRSAPSFTGRLPFSASIKLPSSPDFFFPVCRPFGRTRRSFFLASSPTKHPPPLYLLSPFFFSTLEFSPFFSDSPEGRSALSTFAR